jgi:Ala-tRNA(Pro) deacylase
MAAERGARMPINAKLLSYLTSAGARYKVFPHQIEFTAQEIAEVSRVPGRELVKLVVLRDADGSYLGVALPASARADLARLERVSNRRGLKLASEHELRLLFPDCQIGTAPPFGHVYGLSLLLDPCLLQAPEIYFQAGNHREVVSMSRDEFRLLARPTCAGECLHGPASTPQPDLARAPHDAGTAHAAGAPRETAAIHAAHS